MDRAGTVLRPLALVFALSGCAGLVHEVAWARVLGQSLGNSLQSLTAVLVAFLGGLGFGAAAGARLAGRSRDPLRLYAVLEGLLTLYAGVSPALAAAVPAILESAGPGRASVASLVALRFALQQADHLAITQLHGCVQRTTALEGGRVDPRAAPDQLLEHRPVVVAHCQHQLVRPRERERVICRIPRDEVPHVCQLIRIERHL